MRRPRLAEHGLVRRHVIDGTAQVALHDAASGAVLFLSPQQWRIVQRADGTRDVLEIAEAAAVDGAPCFVEAMTILGELERAGLIEEGPAAGPAVLDTSEASLALEALDERRVAQLPGFALECDGRGECCECYLSVALTADDAERARSAGPRLFPGEASADDGWTPLTGAARTDRFAMALVDGRCLQLEADGRCGLHIRGGERAKPIACRTYPITFLDDGEVVRASVGCECSCVFRSLATRAEAPAEGELLPGVRTVRDLPRGTEVRALPAELAVTAHVGADRAEVAAWSRGILAASAIANPVAMLLKQSLALRERAYSVGGHPDDAPIEPRALLEREVAAFARAAEDAASSSDAWRSARDRTRLFRRRTASAARRAADPARLEILHEALGRAREETFYVRAGIYGHTFGAPLAEALARAAARLIVARELDSQREPGGHPIAMVEMVYRGFAG